MCTRPTSGWYRDYYLLLTELLTTYPELRLGLLGPELLQGLGSRVRVRVRVRARGRVRVRVR